MTGGRFAAITDRYRGLRIGVVGDFFLDRYLIIDPARSEISIETGLPVHNVVEVRSQPGAAGTILNNLAALGVGEIRPVGFCGEDGEGYELRRALAALPGVILDDFFSTPARRTPVYGKPLVVEPPDPPRELNRLDFKNWTPTPEELGRDLASRLLNLAGKVDAILLLDQVELPGTGVVTAAVRDAALTALRSRPQLLLLADSRQGLGGFPPLAFKMNAAELGRMVGDAGVEPAAVARRAAELSARTGQPVFITLAERGMVGALPGKAPEHVAAFPLRGEIDIVGAGDSVTANLAATLSAGADAREAMELAMAAASLVIHQLGTSGVATVPEIRRLLLS